MAQPGLPGSQFPGEDAQIRRIQELERQVQQFSAANVLATAGIGVIPNGVLVNGMMQFKRADGTVGVQVDPADGTFVAYNAAGTDPVARFGSLVETAPGSYGVEVLVGATWVQVGAQATTWDTVSGKPATFPPTLPIAAANVSGTIAEAAHAADADGSAYAFNNVVGGTSWFAVWVDSNFKLAKNTSSILYKENVRAHDIDPDRVLALRPVLFDRKAGGSAEYGLIAEQVAEHFPEIAIWFDGAIDNVRYDLLSVGLLSVAKRQQTVLDALVGWATANGFTPPPAPVYGAPAAAPAAPSPEPAPLPYTIQPQ